MQAEHNDSQSLSQHTAHEQNVVGIDSISERQAKEGGQSYYHYLMR